MERIFAAIDDGIITNTFVGDDDFVDLVRSDHDKIVEITNDNPRPGIRWTVESDGYRPPSPYPSWVWTVDAWQAPISKPEIGDHRWNESTQSWVEINPAAS